MSALPAPFGCRWCGIEKRPHCQQWKAPVGWHKWERPTDEQIKERMLARRASRALDPVAVEMQRIGSAAAAGLDADLSGAADGDVSAREPLSADRLAEYAALAEAATPGPWCTDAWEIYQGSEYQPGISEWIGETCRGRIEGLSQDKADAAFVAAARSAVPELLAEVERLRAERDAFCDRVDTLTEVAKGNKRHVAELFAQLQTTQRERDEARERYTAGLRRADEQVREMNAELKRYADGDEQPVLWSVYNAMHKRAVTAEARVAELEQHTTTVRAEGGAYEVATMQHRTDAPGIVAWQSHIDQMLRCLRHIPPPAARAADCVPVTADDLPDGGICTYPGCGMDVLIAPSAAEAGESA